MRERGKTTCHPTDRGPENRETIQSAADAANCPLIIRTKAGWGWKGVEAEGLVATRLSRFRRMKGAG